jgi:CspA family cold shock protein
MATGKIKWFNNAKGWGFIATADDVDAFVHYADVAGEGYKTLEPGDAVEYDLAAGPKGPKAVNVRKA